MKQAEKNTLVDQTKLDALEAKREKKKEKKNKLEAAKSTKPIVTNFSQQSIHPEAR